MRERFDVVLLLAALGLAAVLRCEAGKCPVEPGEGAGGDVPSGDACGDACFDDASDDASPSASISA